MSPLCRIETLGGLRMLSPERADVRFRTKRTGLLLAYLAIRAGAPVPRDEAAEKIWPDADLDVCRNNLRIALAALRKTFSGLGFASSPIKADRNVVSLRLDRIEVDVCDFETLARSLGNEDRMAAIALWQNEFLAGFDEPWIVDERLRLGAIISRTVAETAEALFSEGNFHKVLELVRQTIRFDPYNEAIYRTGIRAALAASRSIDAHMLLAELRERLYELGAAPSQETLALLSAVPGDAAAVDTDFVGRTCELAKIVSWLLEGARLITVCGPGGIGKTRVVRRTFDMLASQGSGPQRFIEMANAKPGCNLPQFIADSLSSAEERSPSLSSLLGGGGFLALDNLEHLLPSANGAILELLRTLPNLQVVATSRKPLGLPEERVLRLSGLSLPAGSAPESSEAVRLFMQRASPKNTSQAIGKLEIKAVVAICTDLAGIPLAIELAAAKSRFVPVSELLNRLRKSHDFISDRSSSRDERHRSMEAALRWSLDSLTNDSRDALAEVSVFRVGFDLAAAEEVTGRSNTLELLEELVGNSLVYCENARFGMLEPVRECVLKGGHREKVAKRHFEYFAGLLKSAFEELESQDQGLWLEKLELEQPNILSAWEWGRLHAGPHQLVDFAIHSISFWLRRGSLSVGRSMLKIALDLPKRDLEKRLALLDGASRLADVQCDFFEVRRLANEGLDLARDTGSLRYEAEFLTQLGVLERRSGNIGGARLLWTEALKTAETCANKQLKGRLYMNLAVLIRDQGDYVGARSLYESAASIFGDLGDPYKRAIAIQNMGLLACEEGDYEESVQLIKETLALRGRIGDAKGIAFSLGALGQTALAAKHPEQAWPYYLECIDLCLKLDNTTGLSNCLWDLALAWSGTPDAQLSAVLLGALERIYEEVGIGLQPDEVRELEKTELLLEHRLGLARLERLKSEGKGMSLGEAVDAARAKLIG